MPICYNKLWKILIDRGMSKTDLIESAKITTNAMTKLGKNESVMEESGKALIGIGVGSGEDLSDTSLPPR